MLSKTTVNFLMTLPFRSDAQRGVCVLPLGSIYWDDEMPDLTQLMRLSEDDRTRVLRLFSLRFKFWDGEALTEEELIFWNGIREQVPNWALFSRLELSESDQAARAEAEAEVEKALGAFFGDADQITIREKDGVQHFSATFDLTKMPEHDE
jgi:hypothetical protein